MPPYLHEPSGRTCWGCDREDDELVAVTLRSPTDGAATFRLCRPCYHAVFPRVVALAEDAGLVVTARENRPGPA